MGMWVVWVGVGWLVCEFMEWYGCDGVWFWMMWVVFT